MSLQLHISRLDYGVFIFTMIPIFNQNRLNCCARGTNLWTLSFNQYKKTIIMARKYHQNVLRYLLDGSYLAMVSIQREVVVLFSIVD